MTDELAQVDLPAAALSHVRSKLTGWGRLEDEVVPQLTSAGRVWTLVPASKAEMVAAIRDEELLAQGGVSGPSATDSWLRAELPQYLDHSPDAVVLLHHLLARFGDGWTKRATVRLNFIDEAAFCLLDAGTRHEDYVAAALREFALPHRVMLWGTAQPSPYEPHHPPDWFEQSVRALLQSWTLLMVEAFDGESFIAVERR